MTYLKLLSVAFLSASCHTALTQPPGKHWEAVAYQQSTNELAVFSGAELKDGKWINTDSLWLFNGKWRFVDGNSISGRWAHALTYHDNSLYTYGGLKLNARQEEEVLNDLHRFTGSWTRVADGPRLAPPHYLNSVGGKLFLSGISLEGDQPFVVWELVDNRFQKVKSVSLDKEADVSRTMAVNSGFVVFYFADSGPTLYNITSGQKVVVKDLPHRRKFAMTYHAESDSYYLFGGMDQEGKFTNDLWQIKNGLAEKLVRPHGPSPRASCNLVPSANGFILYGGTETGGTLSNSIWRFERGNWLLIE